VSLSDARATLADIHGHSPDYRDKSLAEFQEVLKIDPDNASALRGLGFAYMQQKDFEHAAEYLHRAAQRDSKDPRVHYYYALLLSREGPPDSARAAEIKKELEASLALDPTLADAYSLLGYTQAFSGEPEKGLISLKKAIQLSPRNERYLFNLANVCMMNNRIDDAILIFRSLATSRDPQVAMQSDQALAQAITFKEQTKQVRVQLANHSTDTTPTQKLQESAGVDSAQDAALPAKVPTTAIHFLKGKIVALDCSAPPQAMMTVASGPKSITLHIRDSAHVVLLGADAFSCDWKGQSVAVNYRDRSDGDGDVVSLEMQ
jgi:tetratricopeptide (TPR) repeat protein